MTNLIDTKAKVGEFMMSINWDAITDNNKSNLEAVRKELYKLLEEAIAEGERRERERTKDLILDFDFYADETRSATKGNLVEALNINK